MFGLAPLSIEKEENEKIEKRALLKYFFNKMIPICGMLLSLSQFSLLLKMVNGTMIGVIHTILFYGYFMIVVSSNIVGNVQCLVRHSAYLDIIGHIHRVERLFMNKFSKPMDYRTSKFKVKAFMIFFIQMGATLTSYFNNDGWQLLTTVVTVLEIVSSLVCLHCILYIDIISMFVQEMRKTLNNPRKLFIPSVHILQRCKHIKEVKIIHFELWTLVQKINSYFGWNLLFLITKFFVDITYNMYWFFIEFQILGWESYTHTGKTHIDVY